MARSRDFLRFTAEASFNFDDYQELSPNADTKRYPADPSTFDIPWDYFEVTNDSAVAILVAFDETATALNGQKIAAGDTVVFRRRTESYISIYGGDNTAIPIRIYRW